MKQTIACLFDRLTIVYEVMNMYYEYTLLKIIKGAEVWCNTESISCKIQKK